MPSVFRKTPSGLHLATAACLLGLAVLVAGCNNSSASPTPRPYSELLAAVGAGHVVLVQQYGDTVRAILTDGRDMVVLVPNILTDVQADIVNTAQNSERTPPPFQRMTAPPPP